MDEREIVWREYGETVIHPLALTLTLVMGIWLLFTKRERAVLPLALVATLVPVTQRVVIATLDFDMSRILILFGWARILIKGEYRGFRRHSLDVALIAWLVLGTVAQVLREGNFGAFVYRLGIAFDACGIYFLLRMLLRSGADVFRAVLTFSVIAAIVGAFMVVENITGQNVFAIFGGVPEETVVRNGRLRCTGAFSHPIMAGSFGAGLAPIMLMLFFAGRQSRPSAFAGFIGATLIVVTSASSGPALAFLAGLLGCTLWVVRGWLRPIRIVTLVGLLIIHLVREQPVWHLIGRASDLIGGTGYHRVRLISAFVDNWTEWFWVGVDSTAHWGWGLQDVTNQFVGEGVEGGFLNLAAFMTILLIAFRSVGRARRRARAAGHVPPAQRRAFQLLSWGLGVSLAAHCVSWVSVSYFGQMRLVLYMLYAFIVALDLAPELKTIGVRHLSHFVGSRIQPGSQLAFGPATNGSVT